MIHKSLEHGRPPLAWLQRTQTSLFTVEMSSFPPHPLWFRGCALAMAQLAPITLAVTGAAWSDRAPRTFWEPFPVKDENLLPEDWEMLRSTMRIPVGCHCLDHLMIFPSEWTAKRSSLKSALAATSAQ